MYMAIHTGMYKYTFGLHFILVQTRLSTSKVKTICMSMKPVCSMYEYIGFHAGGGDSRCIIDISKPMISQPIS